MNHYVRSSITALAACALLSGCTTTPNGWRKKTPMMEVVSSKSTDDVIRCVSDLWQSWGWSPNYLPSKDGGTLTLILPGLLGPSGQVGAMLDVEKAAQGNIVRLYGHKFFGGPKEQAKISACL